MIAIHIGLSKAGSSTIQNFFARNRSELLYLSLDYPQVALSNNNHHNIVHEISGSSKFDPRNGSIGDMVDYRRISKKPNLFLSSEVFEFLETEHIANLKSQLLLTGENEFIIIMIVRDLVELIPSSYAQKIKYGRHDYDFDIFFRRRMQEDRVNHYNIAVRWADVFGWESLKVRALDAKFLTNGDLLDDILCLLGIDPLSEPARRLNRKGIRNVSPGWRVLEAFRALYDKSNGSPKGHKIFKAIEQNARERTLGRIALAVGGDMGWNEDKGTYLTRNQARKCLEVYQRNIVLLNGKVPYYLPFAPELDARGFKGRVVLPSVELIPRDELLDFYDRVAEKWFASGRNAS